MTLRVWPYWHQNYASRNAFHVQGTPCQGGYTTVNLNCNLMKWLPKRWNLEGNSKASKFRQGCAPESWGPKNRRSWRGSRKQRFLTRHFLLSYSWPCHEYRWDEVASSLTGTRPGKRRALNLKDSNIGQNVSRQESLFSRSPPGSAICRPPGFRSAALTKVAS